MNQSFSMRVAVVLIFISMIAGASLLRERSCAPHGGDNLQHLLKTCGTPIYTGLLVSEAQGKLQELKYQSHYVLLANGVVIYVARLPEQAVQ